MPTMAFASNSTPSTVTDCPSTRSAYGETLTPPGNVFGGVNESGWLTSVPATSTASPATNVHAPAAARQSTGSTLEITLDSAVNPPPPSAVTVWRSEQPAWSTGALPHSSSSITASGRKPEPATSTELKSPRPESGVTEMVPRVAGGGGAGANEIGTLTIDAGSGVAP